MIVFRNLELVEHLGIGIRRILKRYDKSIYHFYSYFIRVSIKYNLNEFEYDNEQKINDNKLDYSNSELNNLQRGIIELMLDSPKITQDEMSNLLGVISRTIRNHIKYLIDNNYIKRNCTNKNGKRSVNRSIDKGVK